MKAKMPFWEKETEEKKNNIKSRYKIVKEKASELMKPICNENNINSNKIIVYYNNQKEYASIINLLIELTLKKGLNLINTNYNNQLSDDVNLETNDIIFDVQTDNTNNKKNNNNFNGNGNSIEYNQLSNIKIN